MFCLIVLLLIAIIVLCCGKNDSNKSKYSSSQNYHVIKDDYDDFDNYENSESYSGKSSNIYDRFASGTQTQDDELLLSEEDPELFQELYD